MYSAHTRLLPALDDASEWFAPAWALAASSEGPFRVLVCGATPALRRQVGTALRGAAMVVHFAATVDEAMSLARSETFDVAVVNPEMDDGGGLELCRALARGRLGAAVPVVSWCASRSFTLALRSRIAGACMHLPRPVNLDRFVNCVWDVAARRASRPMLDALLH